MAAKGVKVNAERDAAIHREHRTQGTTLAALGRKYGVTPERVRQIVAKRDREEGVNKMSEELHDVVKLLLARMETHPEEFRFHNTGTLAITGRWETWINQLGWYFNEAEKKLIYGKAKEIIFQRVHEEVMDELCNGEERRRKQREEDEYERTMMKQVSQQSMGARLRTTLAPALDEIASHSSITWSKQND